MKVRRSGLLVVIFAAAATAVGCSNSNNGSPVAPVKIGGSPTPAPSATPRPSNAPTATPAPSATPVPSTAPSGTVGNINCTAPVVTTGNYTLMEITEGTAAGNTYTQTGEGEWEVNSYTSPTPTPTPTATAPPSPTPVPSISPVPSPTVTATPQMVTVYIGEYSVPSFTGSPLSGPYTAAATTGCLTLVITQPVGGTIGQIHFQRPAVSATPNVSAVGLGSLNDSDFESAVLDTGAINSFTITNLTTSSGTGSFTLSNSVVGSATITGSITEAFSPDILHSRTLRQQFMRSRLGFDAWRTRGR